MSRNIPESISTSIITIWTFEIKMLSSWYPFWTFKSPFCTIHKYILTSNSNRPIKTKCWMIRKYILIASLQSIQYMLMMVMVTFYLRNRDIFIVCRFCFMEIVVLNREIFYEGGRQLALFVTLGVPPISFHWWFRKSLVKYLSFVSKYRKNPK